jgi:hypothetical protein
MDTLHTLAHQFAPRPQHGLAYSAMPDAPVLPVRPARRRPTLLADARRIGARLRSSIPLTTTAPAPVRADCAR